MLSMTGLSLTIINQVKCVSCGQFIISCPFGADYASLEEAELFHGRVPGSKRLFGYFRLPFWTYIADKHVEKAKENMLLYYSPMVVTAV